MKLRNKKTGEIGYFCFANWDNPVLIIMDKDGVQLAKYPSLAELNEEWEDAPEEPKKFWYMTAWGDVYEYSQSQFAIKQKQAIGNYFESEEEAEKAVEKLKAWKRLKDEYDFKFTGWKRDEQFRGDFIITAQDWNTSDDKLLDLLFGGEE